MGQLQKQNEAKALANPAVVFAKKTTTVLDQSDILIPKLLLMQGLSKLVTAEKAQLGDTVNSVTGKALATRSETINFIPLAHNKFWVNYKYEGNNAKFIGFEAFTPANAKRPWEEEIDGVKYRHDACLNFFVFLESDLDDPKALPYALAFRRTSYNTGKKLVTHFAQCDLAQLAPYAGVLTLSATKVQNNSGTWYVHDVTPLKDTDVKYAAKLEQWSEFLSKNAVKVDDSDIEQEAESTGAEQTQF